MRSGVPFSSTALSPAPPALSIGDRRPGKPVAGPGSVAGASGNLQHMQPSAGKIPAQNATQTANGRDSRQPQVGFRANGTGSMSGAGLTLRKPRLFGNAGSGQSLMPASLQSGPATQSDAAPIAPAPAHLRNHIVSHSNAGPIRPGLTRQTSPPIDFIDQAVRPASVPNIASQTMGPGLQQKPSQQTYSNALGDRLCATSSRGGDRASAFGPFSRTSPRASMHGTGSAPPARGDVSANGLKRKDSLLHG